MMDWECQSNKSFLSKLLLVMCVSQKQTESSRESNFHLSFLFCILFFGFFFKSSSVLYNPRCHHLYWRVTTLAKVTSLFKGLRPGRDARRVHYQFSFLVRSCYSYTYSVSSLICAMFYWELGLVCIGVCDSGGANFRDNCSRTRKGSGFLDPSLDFTLVGLINFLRS